MSRLLIAAVTLYIVIGEQKHTLGKWTTGRDCAQAGTIVVQLYKQLTDEAVNFTCEEEQ